MNKQKLTGTGIPKLSTKMRQSLGTLAGKLYARRHILLNETVVAIDPSCVSYGTGSKPGFAIFTKGEFVEQGILDIPYHKDLAVRLQSIREVIQRDLDPYVAAMLIEETPVRPIRTLKQAQEQGRGFMNLKTIASQKQAIGATKCAITRGKPVIDVPAALWQTWIRNLGLELNKADDHDARLIGIASFAILQNVLNKALEVKGETT
jgi:hypothetical protein